MKIADFWAKTSGVWWGKVLFMKGVGVNLGRARDPVLGQRGVNFRASKSPFVLTTRKISGGAGEAGGLPAASREISLKGGRWLRRGHF